MENFVIASGVGLYEIKYVLNIVWLEYCIQRSQCSQDLIYQIRIGKDNQSSYISIFTYKYEMVEKFP